MISISITPEAYEAIKATLPEGSDSWPAQPDGRGLIGNWLDRKLVNRLAKGWRQAVIQRKGSRSPMSRNPPVLGVNTTWRAVQTRTR